MVSRVEGEDRECGGDNSGEVDDVSCIHVYFHFFDVSLGMKLHGVGECRGSISP